MKLIEWIEQATYEELYSLYYCRLPMDIQSIYDKRLWKLMNENTEKQIKEMINNNGE